MMIWMNLAVANGIILGAMGRSKEIFYIGLIGSWVGQVPGVLIAVYIKKDIISVYYGVSFGYLLLCMLQFYFIFTSDWDHYAQEAIKRVTKQDEEPLIEKDEIEMKVKNDASSNDKSDKFKAIN
jgi:Na+-driven multidrug efflux pump